MSKFSEKYAQRLEEDLSRPVKKDKTLAEFYITLSQKAYNKETDEVEDITLPGILPLDTMKEANIGAVGAFEERKCLGNDLLKDLLKKAEEGLKPGESRFIDLKVKVHRRKTSQSSVHEKVDFELNWL